MLDNEINSTTGGYINAAPLADIPGVDAAYNSLLTRIQALPFVPQEWHANVAKARAANENRLWLPRYAIQASAWAQNKTSPILADVPTWLHDSKNATAWNTLTDWWTARLQPVLAGWARDQKAVMESAQDEASFWNGLYTVVRPVAAVGDAILTAPAKAAEVATGVGLSVLKKFWPLIAVVAVIGIGALVFKNKMMKATP